MASSRRLAAIMFTDIVGYTALTQANETHALALLEAHYQLLRPMFSRHHGREIKTIGDSFLVEFDSALDATNCAVEVQRLVHEYDGSAPEPRRFRLRIGVHLGDVVHTDHDVLGDAINLASRIEPLAEPGGICVSEQVFAQVRNKVPHVFTKLAPVQLKNVAIAQEVYKVELPWEQAVAREAGLSSDVARRLAVLPLANMSADPQDEFFADGLTEEIISELSKVPGLRVLARTSVLRFRATTKGVSEIGKELRVGTVLEGSVRRAGNRIRITAQLIDAATEEHLWSEKYDRELVDVFAIQSEIAHEVATALHVALPPGPPALRAAPDLNAFKVYLRGRHLWGRRTVEGVRAALECFEEAFRIDPTFAAASSGIADCYSILMDRGAMSWNEASGKARGAAERAIRLDASNAEAHASLGLLLSNEFRWSEAEREFQRASELNTMYAPAHLWYYMMLMAQGRPGPAAGELDKAEDADPFSPIILFHRAAFAWAAGTDAEAVVAWNRATELGGALDVTDFYKLVFLVDTSRAREAQELAPRVDPTRLEWFGAAAPAVVHAVAGRPQEAYRELTRIATLPNPGAETTFGIAWTYGALGDVDPFFEWLNRSTEHHARSPFEFASLPFFRKMRADPRFQDYLRRCGLLA